MNSTPQILWLFIVFFSLTSMPFATNAQTNRNQSKSIQEPQSDNFDELIQTGVSLYRQRKFEESVVYFAKAAQLNPQNFRPHALMGLAYQAQTKMKSASDSFRTAIQLNPNDKQLYLSKATVDLYRNAKEEALAACRKALEIDPVYTEALALTGQLLRWDEKRRSEAISAFQSVIKINPRFLAAYEPLAELLEQNNDPKGAEAVFQQGMAADPQKMTGRFAYGRMLVKQGRLAEARVLWNGRTSDADNTFPNFIALLERAENLKRATEALAQKPNDPAMLTDMGLAVMEGDSWIVDGRQERAMVYFQQALKINPNYVRAQYGICKGYIQLAGIFDRYKKDVEQEMEKLRKSDPALADELDKYRKNYRGGIPGGKPVDFNK